AVVEQVERRATLKRYAGQALFVYAAVVTWFRHYDRSRPRFAVLIGPGRDRGPGEVIDDAYFAICLKTNPYTFLGDRPLDVAPDAGLDTGLSFLTFRTLSAMPLLKAATSALRGRGGKRLEQHRRVAYASDLQEVSVSGFGPFPYQVDGDYLGDAD